MEIPFEELDPDTLTRVIEEFVTREGTHYGWDDEATLAEKVARVRAQLRERIAVLTFDADTQTIDIVGHPG